MILMNTSRMENTCPGVMLRNIPRCRAVAKAEWPFNHADNNLTNLLPHFEHHCVDAANLILMWRLENQDVITFISGGIGNGGKKEVCLVLPLSLRVVFRALSGWEWSSTGKVGEETHNNVAPWAISAVTINICRLLFDIGNGNCDQSENDEQNRKFEIH